MSAPTVAPGRAGTPSPGAPDPRPSWVWPVRLIASAVALVVILGGTWSVIGEFFERTTSRTETIGGEVKHLVVDADDGDITIRALSPGTAVVLTTTETHAFADTRITRQLVAGTLMIKGRCSANVHMGDCSTDLDVQVPEDVTVEVTTDLGRVSVDGMAATVRATSSLGRIQLRHLRAAQVEAATDMGELRAQFDTPPMAVRARAGTGSITLTLPEDDTTYRVLAEGNGKAQVEVPQAPSSIRVIVATADMGSIRVLTGS
ncbi:MAG: DUF4097 family beta strand repeat-containing protein [Kineosporiaceae bacterium]